MTCPSIVPPAACATHGEAVAASAAARHVFAYGTLRRGEVNDINLLEPPPTYVGHAEIEGTLYCLGWYPGLTVQRGATVQGEVYRVSPALERRLDEIEGLLPEPTGEYSKAMRQVRMASGGALECVVYEINPSVLREPREVIPHGDWCVFSAALSGR